MKLLHLLTALLFLSLASAAKAAPKKSGCIACVTAEQRARVQKKLDDLRDRVAQLEAENERLRNQAPIARSEAVGEPRIVHSVEKTLMKANIISLVGGMGPDSSLTNRRKSNEGGTEIGYSYGPIVGLQGQHIFFDTVAAGLQVTIPTYPDKKYPTGLASLGYAF